MSGKNTLYFSRRRSPPLSHPDCRTTTADSVLAWLRNNVYHQGKSYERSIGIQTACLGSESAIYIGLTDLVCEPGRSKIVHRHIRWRSLGKMFIDKAFPKRIEILADQDRQCEWAG